MRTSASQCTAGPGIICGRGVRGGPVPLGWVVRAWSESGLEFLSGKCDVEREAFPE